MNKFLTNNFSVINVHKNPSNKSEVVTQMIFGDSFSVLRKTNKWIKIKIKEDGYKGFIKNRKFSNFLKPSHKINILKAKIFRYPNKREKINVISFGSKIKVINSKANFLNFQKDG